MKPQTFVTKRDGSMQEVHFDAILERHAEIINQEPALEGVDPVETAKSVIPYVRSNISTSELDVIAANDAESKKLMNLGYHKFAARLYLNNLYKNSPSTFSESTSLIFKHQERIYYDKINNIVNLLLSEIGLANDDKMMLIDRVHNCNLFKFYKERLLHRLNNIVSLDQRPTNVKRFIYERLVRDITTIINDMVNIDPLYYDWIMIHKDKLDAHISEHASYYQLKDRYAMFGIDTYDKMYFKHGKNNRLLDRIPYVMMRIAVHCHMPSYDSVIKCFDMLNDMQINFATPMYIRACYIKAQTISCIKTIAEDNIESIMKCVYNKSLLSKYGYGIAYVASDIRAAKSIIKSSGGESKGVHAQIMIDKYLTKCWDQGGSRAGSEAVTIDDWHADVPTLLQARKKSAPIEVLDNLHLSLNLHQVFYDRLETSGKWSLFSPDAAVGLTDVWGDEFTQLYEYYERLGLAMTITDARTLFGDTVSTRIGSGEPYIINIDQVNKKSNHDNVGAVKGSNLCCEVMQAIRPDMYANCILASINFNNDVYINWDAVMKYRVESWGDNISEDEGMRIARAILHYNRVADASSMLTFSLNNSLERNYFPVPEAAAGANMLKSLGIGAHGFANLLTKLRLPFSYDNMITRYINRFLCEAKYYGFIRATCDEIDNGCEPYPYFKGSQFSKGVLQFHMWGVTPSLYTAQQWDEQIERVKRGTYNSQGTAHMPTATMSQICDNIEAFELFSGNVFKRVTKHGSWVVINFEMIDHLKELGIWRKDMMAEIELNNGSIQNIKDIPVSVKRLYMTIYEVQQRQLMMMCADRGAYVDQSESFNCHFKASDTTKSIDEQTQEIANKIVAATIFSNKIGMKTSCYYTRTDIPSDLRYRVKVECAPGCDSCSL